MSGVVMLVVIALFMLLSAGVSSAAWTRRYPLLPVVVAHVPAGLSRDFRGTLLGESLPKGFCVVSKQVAGGLCGRDVPLPLSWGRGVPDAWYDAWVQRFGL